MPFAPTTRWLLGIWNNKTLFKTNISVSPLCARARQVCDGPVFVCEQKQAYISAAGSHSGSMTGRLNSLLLLMHVGSFSLLKTKFFRVVQVWKKKTKNRVAEPFLKNTTFPHTKVFLIIYRSFKNHNQGGVWKQGPSLLKYGLLCLQK